MQTLQGPSTPHIENSILETLSPDVPWALIERFSELIRESGSEDEREAARYIAEQLETFGVPYNVYEPELFLSVPVTASLSVNDRNIRAKTPAFSAKTDADGLSGELVYIPAQSPRSSSGFFHFSGNGQANVRGKSQRRLRFSRRRSLLRAAGRHRSDIHQPWRRHSLGHLHDGARPI